MTRSKGLTCKRSKGKDVYAVGQAGSPGLGRRRQMRPRRAETRSAPCPRDTAGSHPQCSSIENAQVFVVDTKAAVFCQFGA